MPFSDDREFERSPHGVSSTNIVAWLAPFPLNPKPSTEKMFSTSGNFRRIVSTLVVTRPV
jgi:hypothetical protein